MIISPALPRPYLIGYQHKIQHVWQFQSDTFVLTNINVRGQGQYLQQRQPNVASILSIK